MWCLQTLQEGNGYSFPFIEVCALGDWGLPGCKESHILNSCPPNSYPTTSAWDTVQTSVFCAAPGWLTTRGGWSPANPSLCNFPISLHSWTCGNRLRDLVCPDVAEKSSEWVKKQFSHSARFLSITALAAADRLVPGGRMPLTDLTLRKPVFFLNLLTKISVLASPLCWASLWSLCLAGLIEELLAPVCFGMAERLSEWVQEKLFSRSARFLFVTALSVWSLSYQGSCMCGPCPPPRFSSSLRSFHAMPTLQQWVTVWFSVCTNSPKSKIVSQDHD